MSLRDIPSVSAILDRIDWGTVQLPRQVVVKTIRQELAAVRASVRNGQEPSSQKELLAKISSEIHRLGRPGLKGVINGTGIVLHTGLGRAPISRKVAVDAVRAAAAYTPLEFDLETGKRGERLNHVVTLITALTGAESALVVNNNAAAVMLSLNTIAEGKEVIISRGQLVEIGGSFRIPDVIEKSGAVMREVGTTNRTHLRDFEKKINDRTAALLYAHTSNYRIEGFTKEVTVAKLAVLAKRRRVPLIVDIGSGALVDFTPSGLPAEPVVREVMDSGAGLVTFSGDKLLGGPQAGIICGKRSLISRLHKNPIYRALRCDKLTMAVLERILRGYSENSPGKNNLAYQLLTTPRKTVRKRGEKVLSLLPFAVVTKLQISLAETTVEAGSGSLPVQSIESAALRFHSTEMKPTELARRFRMQEPPVVGYIKGNCFTIDLKAIPSDQVKDLAGAIGKLSE
ncbi:MAG: L-seryl-tRNA(Sec) selenium transferase [Candidatus Neomarinimicrobiota bacterium]|nr:L-seryl-tRNA(Sec) selenium transferase [Candidatus Neomarinimicrobiota bacterium]